MNNLITEKGIKAVDFYEERFYKMPTFLFENNKYNKMSDSAKIAYMLFKTRFSLALQKNWVDNDGILYLEFTQKSLMNYLNCYQQKVKSIINILEDYELLVVKSMGFDTSTGKNQKNRYYLLSPQLEISDMYKKSENLDNSDNVKITSGEVTSKSLDNSDNVKITQVLDNNKQDTLQDTLLDTGMTSTELDKLASQLESEIDKSQTNSIPEPAKQTLLSFSFNNHKIVEEQIGMIYRAKKEIAKQYNVSLLIENDETGFINAIKTIILAIYKDKKSIHKIKNYDNYFYVSIKKYFEQQAERIQFKEEIKDEVLPNVPMVNWLE